MKNFPQIYLHGSYIGTTGYNNHTRDFVRHLSKIVDIKVRNFTVGKSWNRMENDEPHEGESYLNNTDREILNKQTVLTGKHGSKKRKK